MKAVSCALVMLFACDGGGGASGEGPASGTGQTVFTSGEDPTNAYFVSLGTNQRTCATCHDEAAGWSLSPSLLAERFTSSEGLDPVFRPNDGTTSPLAPIGTLSDRQTAYRLLVDKGLFRVGIAVPDTAEFELTSVADPYAYASDREVSLFRRPLPSTNLRFVTQIMWDVREATLTTQATDATTGHAQAMDVLPATMDEIVKFESSLYTAQAVDAVGGDLSSDGAEGGPVNLIDLDETTSARGFSLFANWSTTGVDAQVAARRNAIKHGEELFNTRRFRIRGVAGLADQQGTCSTCHDAHNIGSHSTPLAVDIGTSAADRRQSDLPLYTLTSLATGSSVRTSDPGVALVTGRWADIGKFKVPSLRALAMRAPYFHDGQARTIDDVIDFYDRRFDLPMSCGDRRDLAAFLAAL